MCYNIATGRGKKKEKTMKWEVAVTKRNIDGKSYWSTIRSFDNPGDADEWLCEFVHENGFSISDFKIFAR